MIDTPSIKKCLFPSLWWADLWLFWPVQDSRNHAMLAMCIDPKEHRSFHFSRKGSQPPRNETILRPPFCENPEPQEEALEEGTCVEGVSWRSGWATLRHQRCKWESQLESGSQLQLPQWTPCGSETQAFPQFLIHKSWAKQNDCSKPRGFRLVFCASTITETKRKKRKCMIRRSWGKIIQRRK